MVKETLSHDLEVSVRADVLDSGDVVLVVPSTLTLNEESLRRFIYFLNDVHEKQQRVLGYWMPGDEG